MFVAEINLIPFPPCIILLECLIIDHIRNRPSSINSSHCLERHNGSHSKNRDKTTPQKTILMRRNQVRICSFKQHVKVCKKEATYKVAMKALCDGKDNNPTHKETFK